MVVLVQIAIIPGHLLIDISNRTQTMAILSKLTVCNTSRRPQMSATHLRRAKLILKLDEQLAAAQALIDGKPFRVTRTKQVKDENGHPQRQEQERRLRPWFWHDTTGKWMMEVRYGAKVLEITQGKRTIEVGVRDQLPQTIQLIQDAVRAGELDQQIEQAAGVRTLGLSKN